MLSSFKSTEITTEHFTCKTESHCDGWKAGIDLHYDVPDAHRLHNSFTCKVKFNLPVQESSLNCLDELEVEVSHKSSGYSDSIRTLECTAMVLQHSLSQVHIINDKKEEIFKEFVAIQEAEFKAQEQKEEAHRASIQALIDDNNLEEIDLKKATTLINKVKKTGEPIEIIGINGFWARAANGKPPSLRVIKLEVNEKDGKQKLTFDSMEYSVKDVKLVLTKYYYKA